MGRESIAELLRLPAGERAELALALWESLDTASRECTMSLSDANRAELDRRLAEHEAAPASAISWADLRASLAADE